MRDVTTGMPLAIASSTTRPKPSLIEGNTRRRRRGRARASASCGIGPLRWTAPAGSPIGRQRRGEAGLIAVVVQQRRAARDARGATTDAAHEPCERPRECGSCSCAPRRRRSRGRPATGRQVQPRAQRGVRCIGLGEKRLGRRHCRRCSHRRPKSRASQSRHRRLTAKWRSAAVIDRDPAAAARRGSAKGRHGARCGRSRG